MVKKNIGEAVDMGTAELSRRLKVVPKFTGGGFASHGKVVDETVIDRLLLEDRITPSDHATLENLMRMLLKANFVGMRSPVYEAPISADPSVVGDRRANQIRAIVSLFRRMDNKIGREKRVSLVNMVLLDYEWPGDMASLQDCVAVLGRVLSR